MTALAHVSSAFEFVLQASLSRAAPLFGPEGERCWAGAEWDPRFLYPHPARDTEGAVFTVRRGASTSLWVNTLFDLLAARMEYVAFTPGVCVSIVDVRLTPIGTSTTHVSVTYARTALDEAANAEVEAMGHADRESGTEWQRDIERCLSERHDKPL